MTRKGYKLTKEHRQKLSLAHKGKPTSRKGKHLSEEHIKHLSESHMGQFISNETRKKISEAGKGIKKPTVSLALKGKKRPIEVINKMKKSLLGHKVSTETKNKISLALKGEKSLLWKGGISFEPYSTDWTETLKRSIRERDHYLCRLCGKMQGDKAFSIHHIDYNKKNCNPNNLITLCTHCHSKTNHNRVKWTAYFMENL